MHHRAAGLDPLFEWLSRIGTFGAVWYLLAAAIAFSRVYVGVHYLSDVIGGAALGAGIAIALLRLSGDRLRSRAATQRG